MSSGISHTQVHRTLVQLPFCGFVTTNYDPVIEAAATHVQVGAGRDFHCESIDLCSDSPDHSFRFLRGLGSVTAPSAVLHVHGFWRKPEQIILSAGDYASRYGITEPLAAEGQALAVPTRPLDSLHRKVVWSLLTMYPVVFIGFSVEDRAFQLMLEFVHEDFKLAPIPPAHFAILGARSDEDRERDATRLRRFGVMPVFYPVATDLNGRPDHSALDALVEEVGASVGVPAAPALENLTRRLMER